VTFSHAHTEIVRRPAALLADPCDSHYCVGNYTCGVSNQVLSSMGVNQPSSFFEVATALLLWAFANLPPPPTRLVSLAEFTGNSLRWRVVGRS
jgi:hypothetical protein